MKILKNPIQKNNYPLNTLIGTSFPQVLSFLIDKKHSKYFILGNHSSVETILAFGIAQKKHALKAKGLRMMALEKKKMY